MEAAAETSSYVGHFDERHIFGTARKLLEEPGYNPEFFRYPSLPIYLTAGTIHLSNLIFGDERQSSAGKLFSVPTRSGQRYEPARAIGHSRVLFATIGAFAFLWVALISRYLNQGYAWAWTAPAMLGLSKLTQRQVVQYHNVDAPTAFFALAALTAVLHYWRHDTFSKKALLPGVLCGLTTACKYNSGLILVPCALAILLAPHVTQKLQKLSVLGLVASLAFVVAMPYSLLDFAHFKADVLYEIEHYKTGHPGYEADPGLPQLVYYSKSLLEDYGQVVCALALLGVLWAFKKNWRLATVVLTFPVLMLAHMCTNRAHFIRTILPVFILIPVFASLGIAGLQTLLQLGTDRLSWIRGRHLMRVVLPSSLVLCGVSWALVSDARTDLWADRNIEPETREQVAAWVHDHVPTTSRLYIAQDLWIARKSYDGYKVSSLRPALIGAEQLIKMSGGERYLLLPVYGAPQELPINVRRNWKRRKAYVEAAKKNAKKANSRKESLVQAVHGQEMTRFDGGKSALVSGAKNRAESVSNVSVVVYRID